MTSEKSEHAQAEEAAFNNVVRSILSAPAPVLSFGQGAPPENPEPLWLSAEEETFMFLCTALEAARGLGLSRHKIYSLFLDALRVLRVQEEMSKRQFVTVPIS